MRNTARPAPNALAQSYARRADEFLDADPFSVPAIDLLVAAGAAYARARDADAAKECWDRVASLAARQAAGVGRWR